jgi:DNA-binding NarL/FixJ family response regulator
MARRPYSLPTRSLLTWRSWISPIPHLNGLETARRLREALPQTKIVLLTMHTEDPYVLEAMQAGAVGYVLKSQAAGDIVQAIREVLQGGPI